MGLPFFPTLPGLTYTSLKTPEFNTQVMSSPNGTTFVSSRRSTPYGHGRSSMISSTTSFGVAIRR